MTELCLETQKEYMTNIVGKTAEVLFEREVNKGIFEGYMTNYVKVRVHSKTDISHKILPVKLTDTGVDFLMGELI